MSSSAAPNLDLWSFECRQLAEVGQLLRTVGLDVSLAGLGLSKKDCCGAFARAVESDSRITELTGDEAKEAFATGLLFGVRSRERGGTGAENDRAMLSVSQVEIIYAPLEASRETVEAAIRRVVDEEASGAAPEFDRELAGFPLKWFPLSQLPLGTTQRGLMRIANELLGSKSPGMVRALGLGFKAGVAARQLDRRMYLDPHRAPRRPTAFFLTCGYDLGQGAPESRELKADADVNDAWREFGWYDHQRLAVHVAAFSCQGAADLPWWPMYSSARPGDLVLVTLADFRPGDALLRTLPEEQARKLFEDWTVTPCEGKCREEGFGQCLRCNAAEFIPAPDRVLLGPDGSPPEHPSFEGDLMRSHMGGRALGVGLVTSRPEWISNTELGAWQSNVGFIRPFPYELELDIVNGLLSAGHQELELREVAAMQFDPATVVFRPEEWVTLRHRLSDYFATHMPAAHGDERAWGQEVLAFQSDLDRIALCSESLAMGSSVEALSAVAPPPRYIPASMPLHDLTPIPEQLELDRMPLWAWGGGSWRIFDPERYDTRPVLGMVGIHETEILQRLRSRAQLIGPGGTGFAAVPVTALHEMERVMAADVASPCGIAGTRLLLPLDPSWATERIVWVVEAENGARLFVALIPGALERAELGVLMTLIAGLFHRGPVATLSSLESALGFGAAGSRLSVSQERRDDPDEVRTSIRSFLRYRESGGSRDE